MRPSNKDTRRFAVALSFPGQHRRFVRNVAERLAEVLGKEHIFFDEWYEAEIRGTDADLKLKRVYRDDAELVVPFFSEHYEKMWCQIEWRAIRVVLAERREQDAVIPVHLDGTRIEGWEIVDSGIRKGRKTGREVADEIIDVYQQRQRFAGSPKVAGQVIPFELVHRNQAAPSHRPLQVALERAYVAGELQDSLVAPIVILALSEEHDLELIQGIDLNWAIRGIRLSDEYFMPVSGSAGHRDWQRDFPQTVTPTLVAMGRSLKPSADAQALIVRLCNAIAARLRVELMWPGDPDQYNDLINEIYSACLESTHLEDDDVLKALKGLAVIGPK